MTEGTSQSGYREGGASVRVAGEGNGGSATSGGKVEAGEGEGRVLVELEDTKLNGTRLEAAPHAGGGGLVNLELKHEVEQMVHISRRRRRRGVGGSWLGQALGLT